MLVAGFMCPALHMQRVIDYVCDEGEVYQNISDPVATNISRLISEWEWWRGYNEVGEILSMISVSTALEKKTQNTSLKRTPSFCRWETALYVETVLCAEWESCFKNPQVLMAERAWCRGGLVGCFAAGLFSRSEHRAEPHHIPKQLHWQNWGSQKMAEQVTGGHCWDKV